MTEKIISFATVVVTYGDYSRLSGLKKTVAAALNAGSIKVYLIDNGCDYDVEAELNRLFSNSVIYQHYEENQGSLVGFESGIRLALNDSSLQKQDYILILDDDVILDDDFLKHYRNMRRSKNDLEDCVWSLYRVGRDHSVDANSDRNQNFYANSIAGFSVFKKTSNAYTTRSDEFGRPFFIPWAGTFAKKSVLAKIKLPEAQYFVYEDDAEFSLNVQDAGFNLLRNYNLKLTENSQSWFEKEGKQQSGYELFYSVTTNPGRFLYKVRNSAYLSKKRLVTNKLAFYTNVCIFLTAGYLRYGIFRRGSFSRLKMLCRAVFDGLNSNLGEKPAWKL